MFTRLSRGELCGVGCFDGEGGEAWFGCLFRLAEEWAVECGEGGASGAAGDVESVGEIKPLSGQLQGMCDGGSVFGLYRRKSEEASEGMADGRVFERV